ncbi:hypothetical protein NC651_039162 [Populus alba x Populus x berolinensis]|uniref:Uncharacterized protein n=1 Tax=Populus alba x Populus x berolinensis TaxID=444605 RepID=A0AAD6PRG5_9ROSI|nr:hypothetical protein NC651_039162 [Populus alba x Populus x berolinensis]KAJ6958586.1 hypothetical protein NC653_040288 [Populus alba x Populus x berolinensis]
MTKSLSHVDVDASYQTSHNGPQPEKRRRNKYEACSIMCVLSSPNVCSNSCGARNKFKRIT